MSQQYGALADLSAPLWTFDYQLGLWRCYDAVSGQFLYHDGYQYVQPRESTLQNTPGNHAFFCTPWNQQDRQPRAIRGGNVQICPQTNNIYPVRPSVHEWHTAVGNEVGNPHVSNNEEENTVPSKPLTTPNFEDIISPALARMSLSEKDRHSLATSATSVSQSAASGRSPYSDYSNESISSRSKRSVYPNEDELLCRDFKKPNKPRNFFRFGKVFLVLWSEPGRDATQTEATAKAWTKNKYEEWVYSKVRRFVVVKEQDRSCMAIPVVTYQGQGVAKKGVKKSDHAIIFTGRQAPSPSAAEEPAFGEAGMRSRCIRVDPDQRDEKLDFMSRVDFSAVQKVQHYCKVKSFGKVNRDSAAALEYQFRAVVSEPRLVSLSGSAMVIERAASEEAKSDPLLARPEFRALYDALIGVKYTSEQAMQFVHQRARDYQDDTGESMESDKDYESERAGKHGEYPSDS